MKYQQLFILLEKYGKISEKEKEIIRNAETLAEEKLDRAAREAEQLLSEIKANKALFKM